MSAGRPDVPISRLLVLRNTAANRQLARDFESILRAAYPGSTAAAVDSLRHPPAEWPGPSLIWADVTGSRARLLDGPPRSVGLGH